MNSDEISHILKQSLANSLTPILVFASDKLPPVNSIQSPVPWYSDSSTHHTRE